MSDSERMKRDKTVGPLERLRDALRRNDKPEAARALAEWVGGSGESNEHIDALRGVIGARPQDPHKVAGLKHTPMRQFNSSAHDRATRALDCLAFEWKHRETLGQLKVRRPHIVRNESGVLAAYQRAATTTECNAGSWFAVVPLPQDGKRCIIVDADRAEDLEAFVHFHSLEHDNDGIEQLVTPSDALGSAMELIRTGIEYTPTDDEREKAYLQSVIAEMRRTGKAVSEERMAEIRETLGQASEKCKVIPPRIEWIVRGDVMDAIPPGAEIHAERIDVDASHVSIRSTERAHIADVTVHVPHGGEIGEETREIASALYWSWWRAQHMSGCDEC